MVAGLLAVSAGPVRDGRRLQPGLGRGGGGINSINLDIISRALNELLRRSHNHGECHYKPFKKILRQYANPLNGRRIYIASIDS